MMCKDHVSALRIKNTNERDPHKKNSETPTGFEPMTSAILVHAMLYQLSYEASLEAGQMRVQFIPVI